MPLMFSCIYTNQKTKKLKKWIDGFILFKRKGLRLYNEEKQFIYNSETYKIVDDYIDTFTYLIYLDNINELTTVNASVSNEDNFVSNSETKIKNTKECEYSIDSCTTYECKTENKDEKETKKYEKTKGRSINDINNLFNN